MEGIILTYLNDNYILLFSTFTSYRTFTKTNVSLGVNELITEVSLIFSNTDSFNIVRKWCENNIKILITKHLYLQQIGVVIKNVDHLNQLVQTLK